MKPLRSSLLQTCVLPLLLAALAARALLPAGFMATTAGLNFTVEMCSPDPERVESLRPFGEPPGDAPAEHTDSCEYCRVPLLGDAFDVPRVAGTANVHPLLSSPAASQLPATTTLPRAQSPRGPPHA